MLSLFLITLFFVFPIHTQVSEPYSIAEGWEIASTCLEDDAEPLEDFEGALFFYSEDANLRVWRHDYPTTYFVGLEGKNFIRAGALSPDGKLFAVPAGRIDNGSIMTSHLVVDEIRIYSTDPRGELVYQFPWQFRDLVNTQNPHVASIQWVDGEHLRYVGTIDSPAEQYYKINIRTGEVVPLENEETLPDENHERTAAGLPIIQAAQALDEGDFQTVQFVDAAHNRAETVITFQPDVVVRTSWFADDVHFYLSASWQNNEDRGIESVKFIGNTNSRQLRQKCQDIGEISYSADGMIAYWGDDFPDNWAVNVFDAHSSKTWRLTSDTKLGQLFGWYVTINDGD